MPNEDKSLAHEPSLTDSAHRGIATTVDTGDSSQSTHFTVQQANEATPLLDERYQLGAEIARGGMGLVHRAVDMVFQREVAVKLLLPKWEKETDPQRQQQRLAQMLDAFRYEAALTARLQHPGIPPVHELGRLSDGLPFLAMKLIQGQTLQQLLQQRTSLLADLPRWLQIFEQIAQAVGYAHSQRVLHRDLKPANIMVGEFGEVQVMDWGLAKVVGEAEKHGVDFEDDDAPTDARQFVSRRGDIKGTLAYMPPEQARGEIDELDPRADVFALGAILCEILTGSPPYTGRTIVELKDQAAAGELTAVQQAIRVSGADAEIVELAIACLSPNASDRPFDGTAVAQSVAAHRANVEQRLRRAETERALSRQQLIEQSRRRKLWYGIAAALLLVVFVSSTLAIVYARSNSIIADREAKATNAANLAIQRAGEARAASERAIAQEKIATDKAAISDAVNKFLQNDLLVLAGAQEQLEAGLEVNPDLKVRDLVLRAAKRIDGKFADQPLVEAETRMMLGISLYRLGEFTAAAKQHERVRELSIQLFGPDAPKTLEVTHALAEAYLHGGKHAEGVALLQELVAHYKEKQGPEHPDTLEQINTLANALRAAGDFRAAVKLYEETLERQTKTLGAEHLSTLQTRHNLAMAYRNSGDPRAVAMLEETAQVIARIHGPDHPDTLGVISNLALLYRSTGQLKRAFPLYEQALEGRRKSLGEDHPDTIAAMSNLAVAYYSADQLDRALPLMQEVLKLRQAKLGPEHLQTLEAMNNLANALQERGDLKEALALSEPVLKLRLQKLGPEHPQTLGSLQNVGNIYSDLRNFEKAIPLLEKALEVRRQKFGEQHADTLRSKQNLSATYCEAKEFAKAMPLLEELLPVHQAKYGDKHPNTLVTMNNLSLAYHEGGQFARAAKIRTDLFKLSSEMFGPRHIRTVGSLLNLAMTETQLKQYTEAEKHLQQVWDDSQQFPAQIKPGILAATADAFVKLYEAWDKFEELAKWQEELKKLQP